MHPASEHALNTDTPTPAFRPDDGPQSAPKATAGQSGAGPGSEETAAGQANTEQTPLTDRQDTRTDSTPRAAQENPPQADGPPAASGAPGSVPQDEAKGAGTKPSGTQPAQQADKSSVQRILANAPTLEQLEKELKKERRRVDFGRVLRNTIFSLVVVAAVSALIAVLFLPVLQIHGTSMNPTLAEQDIVAAVSVGKCKTGDLIAFYYNNNILVKRVIAGPGDWVDIDGDGNVSVNGQPLEEPYLAEKALGNCDLTFPYQVPDARYFVMGDQRSTSVDSRSEAVGCVSREMIIGRIILRVWPLDSLRLF